MQKNSHKIIVDSEDNLIIEKAVNLSMIEIFIGSFLHAFKIPFSGQTLSLNQGVFYTIYLADFKNRFEAAKGLFEVSMVVAMMKALSPVGKKLGPMMSISAQGSLYSIGILFFGEKLFGQIIAMVLLATWAFIQPFITYFIIYGTDIFEAYKYFMEKMQKHLNVEESAFILGLIIVISIKLIIAAILPIILSKLENNKVNQYQNFLSKFFNSKTKNNRKISALSGAFKDLLKPSVVISFVVMFLFFYLSGKEQSVILLKLLRAISFAFIFFYVARSPWFSKLFFKISEKNKYMKRIYDISVASSRELRKHLG